MDKITNLLMRQSTRLRLPAAALLAALAVFGAGCSDPGEEVATTGDAGGRDDPLFVSIEVGGGFVPQGLDFRQPPRAVVYSDGRAFAPGAITLQYPGPAVLPIYRTEVTPAELEQILEAANEAGLTGEERDYGDPAVADAATTTITVVADGQTHVTSIYALDIQSLPGPEGGADQGPAGIDPDAREARQEAQEFIDLVGSAVTGDEAAEFEAERYRVLPLAVDRNEPKPAAEAGLEPQVRDWPFPDVALVANECVAVVGQDAAEFRQALGESNENTRWRTESGELFNLAVRPVLPHEPDCPEEPKPQEPQPDSP